VQKAQDYLDFPTVSVHNSAQSSQKFLRSARLLAAFRRAAAAREAAVNVFLDASPCIRTDAAGRMRNLVLQSG